VLRELAADKQAYRHAREWAKRALEGKIVAPDDHASKLREAMQKMKAPRPDLSKVSSPALSEAVKNAESLWKFMTAPDTPYTDRRAAALQGREVFPVEWLPQLMAAIGELRKEAPQHHWGLRPHPHNNIPYPPNWLDAKLKKMSADQRRRLILGHQWKLPQQASDYPLTWEEEAKAPWPWQVQQTLDDLFVFVRPNYRDEAKAKRWLKAAMQMPCTTDDEAKLFVEASRWSTHFKTMDVMARWRQIALCREFPGAAANAGVYVGEAIRLWDDSRSQAVGQVIVVDILKHSPHKEAKHRAAYGLRHFRERWRAGRYAGKVLRMPEPVTAIITASQMALDPKNGDEWTRLYVYAFSVCEALDSPPMKPDRDMDPESEKVGRALTKFASWFKANRRKLERRATRENAALADVRKVFKSFE